MNEWEQQHGVKAPFSWHAERDGYGQVLARWNGDGWLILGQMTYDEAVRQYGEVQHSDNPIPVWID